MGNREPDEADGSSERHAEGRQQSRADHDCPADSVHRNTQRHRTDVSKCEGVKDVAQSHPDDQRRHGGNNQRDRRSPPQPGEGPKGP